MEHPASMAFGAITNVINNKLFGALQVTVTVESPLQAATFKAGIEPPQVVVPVVQYGQMLKGVVELVAPPGVRLWFGGLTVSLRVAKMAKHGGEPEITPEVEALPKWMRPKATAIVHSWEAPTCESRAYTVLEKGKYEVNGTVRVPFSIPTDALPALESFDAGDGTGVCHWVEANVTTLGWLGKVQYVRDGWDSLQKNAAIQRIEAKKQGGIGAAFAGMNNQPPAVEGAYFRPGGKRADPYQQIVMQVVSPPVPLSAIFEPADEPEAPETSGSLLDQAKAALSEEEKAKAEKEKQAAKAKVAADAASARKLLDATTSPSLSVTDLGGVCTLSNIRGTLCSGGAIVGHLELSGIPSLSKVEMQLTTAIDGRDHRTSLSSIIYSKELADLLEAPDPEGEANAKLADDAKPADDTPLQMSTDVRLDFDGCLANGRQYVCSSYLQPMPLEGCQGPRELGASWTHRPPRDNPDALPSPYGDVKIRHSVRLVLTDLDGKEASGTANILLTRTGLTGASPDTLENGIAPPPPIPMAMWKKVALTVLGTLSFIIMLSFMIPKKFEWGVTKLGLEDQAEFLGLLEPKNGTKQGWTRSIVATGTQTVKRFLTGHR